MKSYEKKKKPNVESRTQAEFILNASRIFTHKLEEIWLFPFEIDN